MIAIAIDDEPPALRIIEIFCAANNDIELKRTFTDPSEALRYMKAYPVDVMFTDIHMPGQNGIDLYKGLKTKPLVIFTTAYAEHAVEGFNVKAVDYLLKPYPQERFNVAVDRAMETFKAGLSLSNIKTISVRSNYSLTKIMIDEILLIESQDDYLTIHLHSGKTIVTRMTLKKMLDMLPENEFIRVHRSFALPWKMIDHVRNKVIYLKDKKIPIGTKFEDHFFDYYSRI